LNPLPIDLGLATRGLRAELVSMQIRLIYFDSRLPQLFVSFQPRLVRIDGQLLEHSWPIH
jgi:hypothetical protein